MSVPSPAGDVEPTAIQREIQAESDELAPGTTQLEHFGRTWVVPVKRHFRHVQAMRNQLVSGFGSWDLLIAETFLSDRLFDGVPKGQIEALWDLNPDDEDLGEFVKKLSAALGLENKGN